jgi:hypothetical protein
MRDSEASYVTTTLLRIFEPSCGLPQTAIVASADLTQLDKGFAVDGTGKNSRCKRPCESKTNVEVLVVGGPPAAVGGAE